MNGFPSRVPPPPMRVKLRTVPQLPNNGQCCDNPDPIVKSIETHMDQYEPPHTTADLVCTRCGAEIHARTDGVVTGTDGFYDNEADEPIEHCPEMWAERITFGELTREGIP